MLVADFTESSLLSDLCRAKSKDVYERVPDDSSPTRIKPTGPLAWWLVFGLSCLGLNFLATSQRAFAKAWPRVITRVYLR